MLANMKPPLRSGVGRRPSSDYTLGDGYYAVVPSDLATIYNLSSAFTAGYTGLGRTIALIEDTDVYNYPGDWNSFRSTSVFRSSSRPQLLCKCIRAAAAPIRH